MKKIKRMIMLCLNHLILRACLNLLPLFTLHFKSLLSLVQATFGDRVIYKGFLWTLKLKDFRKSRWVVISLRRHTWAQALICGIRMFLKIERQLPENQILEDHYGLHK